MEIMSLGEKIKRLRKEKSLTLKDLAGERITPGQISLVESGKSNPSIDLLEYLVASLGTSIEYLMESEESQAEKICYYYENLAEAHSIKEEWDEAEKYIEESLHYSDKYKLDYRKGKSFYLKGKIYLEKGDLGEAQKFFLMANEIFVKECNYEDVINTFLNLGAITYTLKSYNSSLTYFQQAEKIFIDNEVGNDLLKGKIYYYLTKIYFKVDDSEKALNYANLAVEKFRQLDNKKEYAETLMTLSKEYMKKDKIDVAIKYSKRSLEEFNKVENEVLVSKIENDLGKIFYSYDNLKESFIRYEKAKELRAKNEKEKVIETLLNICTNYIYIKDVDQCSKVIQEIEEYSQYITDSQMVELNMIKYRLSMLRGNEKEAETYLLLAVGYAENRGMTYEAAQLHIIISNFYISIGENEESKKYLTKGIESFKKVGMLNTINYE